jgi:hypothetical protein
VRLRESVTDLLLLLAVQELDFYFDGQKLCFVRFDENEDMQSS